MTNHLKKNDKIAPKTDKPIKSPPTPREAEGALLASLERVNKVHGKTLEKLAR